MSAWLITGGAGFIGCNFLRQLCVAPPARLVVLDALTYAGNLANIADLTNSGAIDFEHGDIRDARFVREVFARHEVDRVIHFAAESHVDRSILGPTTFVETNVVGTLNLLQAARDYWRDNRETRFLHVSTDEVYGSLLPLEAAFDEQTAYAPNSPYAASKAAADHLARAWHRTYGLPVIVTNCSNNYGPWQFPEKLIPLTILNAIDGVAIPLYGDGLQIRDWLHVEDHCEALRIVLDTGTVGATYCVGGDNQLTNVAVVTAICDLVDAHLGRPTGTSRKLIRHVEDRPGHDYRYAIDARKIRNELGWSPRRDFTSELAKVVEWYVTNRKWVDQIRSGDYLRFYDQQYAHRLEASA